MGLGLRPSLVAGAAVPVPQDVVEHEAALLADVEGDARVRRAEGGVGAVHCVAVRVTEHVAVVVVTVHLPSGVLAHFADVDGLRHPVGQRRLGRDSDVCERLREDEG